MLGLAAVDVAHNGNDGVVLGVVLLMEGLNVVQRYGADALLAAVGRFAVGMAGVVELGLLAVGDVGRIALRLAQREYGAILQAF